jgi:hypothetical protein
LATTNFEFRASMVGGLWDIRRRKNDTSKTQWSGVSDEFLCIWSLNQEYISTDSSQRNRVKPDVASAIIASIARNCTRCYSNFHASIICNAHDEPAYAVRNQRLTLEQNKLPPDTVCTLFNKTDARHDLRLDYLECNGSMATIELPRGSVDTQVLRVPAVPPTARGTAAAAARGAARQTAGQHVIVIPPRLSSRRLKEQYAQMFEEMVKPHRTMRFLDILDWSRITSSNLACAAKELDEKSDEFARRMNKIGMYDEQRHSNLVSVEDGKLYHFDPHGTDPLCTRLPSGKPLVATVLKAICSTSSIVEYKGNVYTLNPKCAGPLMTHHQADEPACLLWTTMFSFLLLMNPHRPIVEIMDYFALKSKTPSYLQTKVFDFASYLIELLDSPTKITSSNRDRLLNDLDGRLKLRMKSRVRIATQGAPCRTPTAPSYAIAIPCFTPARSRRTEQG